MHRYISQHALKTAAAIIIDISRNLHRCHNTSERSSSIPEIQIRYPQTRTTIYRKTCIDIGCIYQETYRKYSPRRARQHHHHQQTCLPRIDTPSFASSIYVSRETLSRCPVACTGTTHIWQARVDVSRNMHR